MKIKTAIALFLLIFTLAACIPPTAAPTLMGAAPATATLAVQPTTAPAVADPAKTAFQTALGELRFVSAGFVDEVNGVKPNPGCKILLVYLQQADGKPVDLQAFQDAHMEIFIRGEDGSNTLSTMGGFVGQQFAIGFQVPETIHSYVLLWPENTPVDLTPGLK